MDGCARVSSPASPDQLATLRRLNLQFRAPYLLKSPRTLQQIRATDDQKEKIRKLQKKLQESIRRLQKKSLKRTLEVLTPEQREQLKEIGSPG